MTIRNELLESGIPAELIPKLSYRDVTAEEAQKLTGFNLEGWVVAMRSPTGEPYKTSQGKPFFRIKPAKPFVGKNGKRSKYLSPSGEGCRLYFSPLLTREFCEGSQPITITEGEKKADALNAHGFPAIGLSGVDAWRDQRSGESRPLPEWDDVNLQGRQVFIAYDSDVTVKDSVRDALKKLCLWLITEKQARPYIVLLPPELTGDKNGADDFLLRHGAAPLKLLYGIARPCGDFQADQQSKQFNWQPEPREVHDKALTAWTAFNGSYANRPNHGVYRWADTHWEPIGERDREALKRPLHKWMDEMGWRRRGDSVIGSVVSEVLARLKEGSWDRDGVMAFSNGTLRGGVFTVGHDRNDRLTFCFPFPYDTGAKCPKWLAFINHALKGQADSINLLRAAIWWSISPKDPSSAFPLEHAFDVHGPKGHGKGTVCEVLSALCGDKRGVGLIKSAGFSNPNSLHGLIGKRIAIDPDASGHIKDVGNFNAIVSNEPVEVMKKYQDTTSERLGVVIWRFFNDTPSASGGGLEGMGRRIVTFRFDNPVSTPDPNLKEKLRAEAAGIFMWAWSMSRDEAFTALKNRGQIKAIRDASIAAALDVDHTLRFVVKRYPEGNPSKVRASDLYKDYREWMAEGGHQSVSQTKFGREVKKVPWVEATTDNAGTLYELKTHTHHQLATHIGLPMPPESDGELNPPQQETHHHNPPPADPASSNASQRSVVSLASSPCQNKEGEEESEGGAKIHIGNDFQIKPTKPTTLTTDLIHTNREWVEMAQHAGNRSAAGIASWIKCNGGSVARADVERALKRQEQQSLPLAQ